jgi:hypothetical protein
MFDVDITACASAGTLEYRAVKQRGKRNRHHDSRPTSRATISQRSFGVLTALPLATDARSGLRGNLCPTQVVVDPE